MTRANTRQNMTRDMSLSEIEFFDDKGRYDVHASNEANREIFAEPNIVKLPSGGIDHAATLVKTTAAKAVVVARKK